MGRELVELPPTAITLPSDEPEPTDMAAYLAMLPVLVALWESAEQED